MSTFAYATLTTKRQESTGTESEGNKPPGVKTFLDALAAIVPAEVLLAHAAIIPLTTSTGQNEEGQSVTTITEESTLQIVFFALIAVSAALYLIAKWPTFKIPTDLLRLAIPPIAFVGWTMLQQSTAFDAVAPDLDTPARFSIAIVGAVVLGALAVRLGSVAESESLNAGPSARTAEE